MVRTADIGFSRARTGVSGIHFSFSGHFPAARPGQSTGDRGQLRLPLPANPDKLRGVKRPFVPHSRFLGWVTFGLTLTLLSGCGSDVNGVPAHAGTNPPSAQLGNSPSGNTNKDVGPVYHLDHAQPKLPTVRLRLGAYELDAEVCQEITQIATGLMFRPGIGPEEGMLFVFNGPYQPAFYMKNVGFDIDVAYIDTEGVITEVVRLKAQDRTPVSAKSDRVQFVLEAAPDYFTKHGLGAGTLIVSARGTLKETFRSR